MDDQITRRSSINPRGSSDEFTLPESSQATSHKSSHEITKSSIPEINCNVKLDKDNYVIKKKQHSPIKTTQSENSTTELLNPTQNTLVVDDGRFILEEDDCEAVRQK